ncbi:hypothetical protein N749_02725 [Legionella pneumophila str. Leg01/20]|nr:hypothetical protein N749_02725 [Legionella pneumophila str. Leg01/20]
MITVFFNGADEQPCGVGRRVKIPIHIQKPFK